MPHRYELEKHVRRGDGGGLFRRRKERNRELEKSASERPPPPPRGIVKTKPVLPRGRESRSLYRVHDRNEERACARARSQERQEVVGSFIRSTGSYGLRMAD